ncbi:MAG: hypothetical protein QM774_03460 [Gordonia sp. (in: high G+C Gram-positive bacteria)]|uniref:hypothetical protein n=1 Tax=Gordonia sp. (in: high G+C Gram-positive bacteria) TaxID=84139 RepID=UPI0039E342DC
MTNPADPQNPGAGEPAPTQVPIPGRQPDYSQIPVGGQQPFGQQPPQPGVGQQPPVPPVGGPPHQPFTPQQPFAQQPFGQQPVAQQPVAPQPFGQPLPGVPMAPGAPGAYPQYAPQAPQQGTSKTGLWIGLGAAAVIVLAVLATLLILKPWSSKGVDYSLGHDVVVTVKAPDGWKSESVTYDGEPSFMLLPTSETRSADAVLKSSEESDPAELHGVLGSVRSCDSDASSTPGTWQLNETKSDADGQGHGRTAALRVDTNYCLDIRGVDLKGSGTPAVDLVQQAAGTDKSMLTARSH